MNIPGDAEFCDVTLTQADVQTFSKLRSLLENVGITTDLHTVGYLTHLAIQVLTAC